jgi:tetratricopeptide (TPR) repeat protein
MSSIKQLLIKARQAIDQQNYKEAKEICQDILTHFDENQYNALVFLGLSLSKLNCTEESVSVFEKAITLQPKTLLAYQVINMLCYIKKIL